MARMWGAGTGDERGRSASARPETLSAHRSVCALALGRLSCACLVPVCSRLAKSVMMRSAIMIVMMLVGLVGLATRSR
eukprot:3156354-Rhodomonas_salina.1